MRQGPTSYRYPFSLLIAIILHVVMFLFGYGMWGNPSSLPTMTFVYSRIVEIEPVLPAKSARERDTAAAQQRAESPKTDTKIATEESKASVEKKATTTEITQKNETTKTVTPSEENESKPETTVPPSTGQELPTPEEVGTENEKSIPTAPSLPPLGNGQQMVGFHHTVYPKNLLNTGVEGVVKAEIYVNTDGTLLRAPIIIESSGHSGLDTHCIRTMEMIWQYKPAPKPYKLVVELKFSQDQVSAPRFLEEAVYLSPEEGGTSDEN